MFCFFISSATTEIYTYSHTLSRPDALPIAWRLVPPPPASCSSSPAWRGWRNEGSPLRDHRLRGVRGCPPFLQVLAPFRRPVGRSLRRCLRRQIGRAHV